MITFTFDGKPYQVKEGTTWYEFCQQHPETKLKCRDTYVIVQGDGEEGSVRDQTTSCSVECQDQIRDGEVYIIYYAVACVKANTLILTSLNNETTLAKDVRNGDTIVYYNFETNTVEEGIVSQVYIHRNATNFVKYTFEDGSYLEVTDYHPIYTQEGWKSLTRRNGYEKPQVGDKVKTEKGWKTLTNIEAYKGLEDCYDFGIKSKEGKTANNYFANGTLVQSSIN